MTDAVPVDACDGVFWGIITREDEKRITKELATVVYKFTEDRVEESDLGFKYNILTLHDDDLDDVAMYCAYVGDVAHFIHNQARAGYCGMMVKVGAVAANKTREIFDIVLRRARVKDKMRDEVLSQITY